MVYKRKLSNRFSIHLESESPPTEVDLHVEHHAGHHSHTFVQVNTKRPRSHSAPPPPPSNFQQQDEADSALACPSSPSTASPPLSSPPVDPPTPRYQGASVLMEAFAPHLEDIQNAILSLEALPSLHQLCRCSGTDSLYRCIDCFHSPVLCAKCIVGDHTHNPFHRLEKWSGTHFSRISMDDLNAIFNLGHGGERCPNILPSDGRRLTVVHTNSIHTIFTTFCGCYPTKADILQLAEARLFPATVGHPDTVLTFAFLEDLHIHVLTSKKSVFDHHSAIQRLTNAVSPQSVPNRYSECSRSLRLWESLSLTRRAGQAHNIDVHFPNRIPKSVAVRCSACPEIGFNVDKSVVDAASEDESHKYTLFLSLDGNFRLQRANKRHDPDDVALVDGHAYFVDEVEYQKYLKDVVPSPDNSTCANLRAVRNQNVLKFKNAAVTGVISVQCGRHGFYMPHGTADLEKGEAYARSDYVLVRVLDEQGVQRWIMISYDVWCQYHLNLRKRMEKHFPNHVPIVDAIRGAVPKMHIKGHVDECQYRWSFNYLPNSGETCGEKIETSWAELNQSAGATRQQNAGHRHDSLDNGFGFWNWNKSITLVPYISMQYEDCVQRLLKNETNLDRLSRSHPTATIEKWQLEDTTPKRVDGAWTSVYVAHSKKGRPPSQLKAYHELVNHERIRALAGQGDVGDAEFIREGLRIEMEQHRICALLGANATPDSTIVNARLTLQKGLVTWLEQQSRRFPDLRNLLPNPDLTLPETIALCLPSQWSINRPPELSTLVTVEKALREGQCHDALDSLRTAIKTFNMNYHEKQTTVRGQHPNTRAQAFLDTLQKDKIGAHDNYNLARKALLNLGLSPDDASLQPLNKSQLWGRNMGAPAELGETRTQEPWFWVMGRPSGLSTEEEAEWNNEVEKARWFRCKAVVDRGKEEKEILEEEILRVHTSFTKMASIWTCLATSTSTHPGSAAYAHKQSAMYASLADSAHDAICQGFPSVLSRIPSPSSTLSA